MLPNAVYILDGNWVIVATEPLLFTIMCLDRQTHQKETKQPIFIIQLAQTCEAFADYMMDE